MGHCIGEKTTLESASVTNAQSKLNNYTTNINIAVIERLDILSQAWLKCFLSASSCSFLRLSHHFVLLQGRSGSDPSLGK